MSKINVYSSSASNAIKVFDASSTGLKPDNAILVTTGTEPSNAIQINIGDKKWSSIAVNFGGSEPGPTPPGPTPQGYRYYMWVGTSSYGVDDFNNIFVEASDIAFYPKNESAMTGFNGITGSYATESEPYTNFYDGDINSNWPTLRVEGNNSAVNIFDVGRNVDISAYAIVAEDIVGAGQVKNRTPVCWSLYGRTDYSNNSADDGWNLIETREAPYLANRMDYERVYKFIINGSYKAYSNNKYPELSPEPSDIHTITISPSINGSVSATPSEGVSGTIVTLSNTPNNYYSFEKYNITGATLTGNSFEIGNSDVDVQGVFVADKYNVSYTNDGHGSLTGTLTTATGGMTTTLTATPNTHYNLNNITVTGGTVNGNVLTVTSNCTANASYVPKKYTVTYQTNGNGTLTGGVTTATGNSTTTLTATPNTHYSFSNYSVTGGTINGNTLTITANCTAKANFTMIQPYTLTLQQQTGGTIGANKNTGYNGDTVTLSNTASQNYEFASYSITGATLTGSNFKFGNGNVTAKANFNSIAPAKTFVFSSNRAYNVSATAGNRTGWDNLYKLTPSSYNALDFIYAVDYKFKLTGSKTNAKFEAGIEFGGNYYNWNSTAKRWEGDSWERYNVMYNAQSSLNTGMFPIIRSIGAQELSAFKNFGCENDNNGLYYLNTATDWTNSEVHLKYLGRQKHKNPVSAYMPLRSSFVSSFNPSTNVCLTSGVYGMQYWYVDYMWVYGGFFSGTSNNLKSYPGSSCVTVGLFSTADQAKAYKWLKSM